MRSFALALRDPPLSDGPLQAPPWRPLAAVLSALAVACASAPSPATAPEAPAPPAAQAAARAAQTALDTAGWQALIAADAELAALAKAMPQPLQAAGTITDVKGGALVWAEFAASAEAPRAAVGVVFRQCAKAEADAAPVCVHGKGAYTAASVALTDAAGKAIETVAVAAPSGWEWTTSTNLDSDHATMAAGLTGDPGPLDPATLLAQFAAIHPQQRRFVLLSAYGKLVGVDGAPILGAAKASGRFDSVEAIEFVRKADVDALLPTLTTLDTVVWLGAGVQQKPSPKSPPGKPVGMNVTRGIFGDELYYASTAVKALLDTPPLGGPGLIVLAGQNTFWSESDNKQSLATAFYEPMIRPIVGFSMALGTPTAGVGYPQIPLAELTAATVRLLTALAADKTLDVAMQEAAATAALPYTLTSPMAADNRKKWKWPQPSPQFWPKPPTTGSLQLWLSLVPKCVKPVETCDLESWTASWKNGQQASGILNLPLKLQCQNPTVTGPFLRCTGGNTQPPGSRFSVTGALHGTTAGEHLMFFAQTEAGGPMGGALIVADGEMAKDATDVGGGTTTYAFRGQASVSTYTDANGNCCTTAAPQLTGTSASDLSTLQLRN